MFVFALISLVANAGEIFCTLHCSEHMKDCVEHDGGLTKNFINCQMEYGLCVNACRDSEEEADSKEMATKPKPSFRTLVRLQAGGQNLENESKLGSFWTKADCCACLAGCAEQGRSTNCDSWCSNCQC